MISKNPIKTGLWVRIILFLIYVWRALIETMYFFKKKQALKGLSKVIGIQKHF